MMAVKSSINLLICYKAMQTIPTSPLKAHITNPQLRPSSSTTLQRGTGSSSDNELDLYIRNSSFSTNDRSEESKSPLHRYLLIIRKAALPPSIQLLLHAIRDPAIVRVPRNWHALCPRYCHKDLDRPNLAVRRNEPMEKLERRTLTNAVDKALTSNCRIKLMALLSAGHILNTLLLLWARPIMQKWFVDAEWDP